MCHNADDRSAGRTHCALRKADGGAVSSGLAPSRARGSARVIGVPQSSLNLRSLTVAGGKTLHWDTHLSMECHTRLGGQDDAAKWHPKQPLGTSTHAFPPFCSGVSCHIETHQEARGAARSSVVVRVDNSEAQA